MELEGAGEVEYVGFGWRSSTSFEEFSNVVPRMTAVTELIVRGSASSAVALSSAGGSSASLWLQSSEGGDWRQVWGARVGAGTYSLDGLHVRFASQTVVGVRLSVVGGGGVFEGWSSAAGYSSPSLL